MAKGIMERKGKNGDITYYIRYQFQGKDVRERVGRKSRGFNREMAKEALRSRLGEIARGRFGLSQIQRPHSFDELAERYHKHAAGYKASYSREKYTINEFAAYFKGRNLNDLTSWLIEKWKREAAKEREGSTVNRSLTILKHMLKMAVKWELVATNAASGVAPFPVQEGRIRYATPEEIPAISKACQEQVTSPWLYPLVVLALNTGARQGELMNLTFEDIDLEHGILYFGRTKNRRLKTIPLNKAAREAIESLSANRYGE